MKEVLSGDSKLRMKFESQLVKKDGLVLAIMIVIKTACMK